MKRNSNELRVQVVFDIICPWCFIGKRSLDQALPVIREKGVDLIIEWVPFQLNPDLPSGGADRKTFRTARFGSWEAALAMDARVMKAGSAVGADFNYDLQKRTSNTLAGHAVVQLAVAEGGAALQERVVDALFVAYFARGLDVGDEAVLDQIATDAGMERGASERALPLRRVVTVTERGVRMAGVNGVPAYLVDNRIVASGAVGVADYVRLFAGRYVAS